MIHVTEHGSVTLIALARPPANAIDLGLVAALDGALAKVEGSAATTALVITGEGGCFSAGIDVKAVPAYSRDQQRAMIRYVNRLVHRFYMLAKPTVAAINGHALGAGLVLALACDTRLAVEHDCKLGLTEVTAGVPFPAGPMVVVRAELDPPAARRLVLTGRTFAPRDAAMAAILDETVPADRLVARALELAATLASAPAYARVKQQLRDPAIRELARIVAADDDPLLADWGLRR